MSDILRDTKFEYTTPDGTFEFPIDPIGGDEVEQTIKRSKKSGGLVLSVIQNLKFVKQARTALINAFNNYGADGLFKIKKQQKRFNTYETVNDGNLTLKTLSYDKTTATADYVENSFDAIFREQIKTKFELDRTTDINGDVIPALVRRKSIHKPRKIFRQTLLKTPENFQDDGNTNSINSSILSHKVQIDYSSDVNTQEVFDGFHTLGSDVSVSNCFHFNSSRSKTLKLTIDAIILSLSGATGGKWVIEKYNNGIDLDFVDRFDLSSFESNPTSATLTDFEYTIDILEGESLCLGYQIFHSGLVSWSIRDASILQEEDSIYTPKNPEDNNIDCITVKDAFERITRIMSPDVIFRSTLIDDNWSDLIVRSGETIRHVRYIDNDAATEEEQDVIAPILTRSFNELHKDLFYIQPCAYTITVEKGTTYLNLEAIDYAFDRQEVVNLGTLQDVDFEVDNDSTFGTIEIGSTKSGDIEGVYGLQATHTLNKFKLPCNTAETVYDAKSTARFDPTETELCWRTQFKENPDLDTKYDKDAFYEDCELINISGFDFYVPHEWQEHFTAVSGIYEPDSATNYRLSPINCLERHAPNFKQEYMKPVYDDKKVQYTSTSGSVSLKTQPIGGVLRQENADILITDLDDAMYTNLKITGECHAGYDLVKLINGGEDKPNYMKTFLFNWNSNEYKVFAWDITIGDKIKIESKERYN